MKVKVGKIEPRRDDVQIYFEVYDGETLTETYIVAASDMTEAVIRAEAERLLAKFEAIASRQAAADKIVSDLKQTAFTKAKP